MKIKLNSTSDSIPLSEVQGEFWGVIVPHSCPNPNWDNSVIYIKQDSNLALLFDEAYNRISIIDLDGMGSDFLGKARAIPLLKGSKLTITV